MKLNNWTYDTNTGDIKHSTSECWQEANLSFAEFALNRLCADNMNIIEHGDPLGPVAIKSEVNNWWIVSAWCSGRQWFYMVDFWTTGDISEEEAHIITSNILDELGIEDGCDEEDEDSEEDEDNH